MPRRVFVWFKWLSGRLCGLAASCYPKTGDRSPVFEKEGSVKRLGSTATRRVDVRVIAATNRDLEDEVAAGRFRRDLFWLSGAVVEVPPLRDRLEDVEILARAILDELAAAWDQPGDGGRALRPRLARQRA